MKVRAMTLGPTTAEFKRDLARGDCPTCGGQCAPECGLHPAGCVWGGFGHKYWMIAEGCTLDHGEKDIPNTEQ